MSVFCTVCIIALFALLRLTTALFHQISNPKDSKRGDLDHQQYSQIEPRALDSPAAEKLRGSSERLTGVAFQ
jgi:hypothetical protein